MEKAKKTCGHSQGVLQIGVHSSLVDAHDLAEHLILAMQFCRNLHPIYNWQKTSSNLNLLHVYDILCLYHVTMLYHPKTNFRKIYELFCMINFSHVVSINGLV